MAEQQQIAISIPLDQIHPDPKQPRRLLPADLADVLNTGASPSDVLAQLRERSRGNAGIRRRLEEMEGLADSIFADGLMQPIRVIKDAEDSYRIEEGERRWWAHHILMGRGESRFNTINAFVADSGNEDRGILRRRVAENVLRSEFTAMELARAMATRREEIATEAPTLSRREIETRVGKENAMSDRRVRQYLALLTLPLAVQELAQQARLSESSLRGLIGMKDRKHQLAAARALIHPAKKQKPDRLKTKAGKRTKNRANLIKTASSKIRQPRRRIDAPRIIGVAKSLDSKSARVIGEQLAIRLLRDEMVRSAIVRLRDVLTGSLEKTLVPRVVQPRRVPIARVSQRNPAKR